MQDIIWRTDPKSVGNQPLLRIVLRKEEPASVREEHDAKSCWLIVNGFTPKLRVCNSSLVLKGVWQKPLIIGEEYCGCNESCSKEGADNLLERDASRHQGDQLIIANESRDEESGRCNNSEWDNDPSARTEHANIIKPPCLPACLWIKDVFHMSESVNKDKEAKSDGRKGNDEKPKTNK